MKIAVTVAVYNEEKCVGELLVALISQSRSIEEIIIVDDGSVDNTGKIIKEYAKKHDNIKYIYQDNAGRSIARNKAWKASTSDICVFTDGDCVPNSDWIENIIKPFENNEIGGVAGTYKTMNYENSLARFIGLEIEWKYRNVKGEIDVHGTYNIAVRKNILEELNGFNNEYTYLGGEDWELTLRISKKYKLIFEPKAIVGHYHPDNFCWYMKNQMERGRDRVKMYSDHPEKITNDTYTGRLVKYQVIFSGVLIPSLIFLFPIFSYSFIIPVMILLFLLSTSLIPFSYYWKKDKKIVFYSILIQMSRNFFWFLGLIIGLFKYGFNIKKLFCK